MGQSGPDGGGAPAIGKIRGTVLDFKSKVPVEFATIGLYKMKDSALVTGVVANDKGVFELGQVGFGRYFIKINFIGYKQLIIDTVRINPAKAEVNLGTILLHSNAEQLGEVEISAERATVELNIDKKVFNVEKSIVSNGGSATDVLQQIPSVSVDIDGNISFRGSGNVTVLIDGRPSSITGSSRAAILEQIPASSIESIELITNPSAKYDPDGMSGIINIVMKKNKLNGLNGSVSVGAGTNSKYNGQVNVSYRNSKINVYANYGYRYNYRTGNGWSEMHETYPDTAYSLYSQFRASRISESNNLKAGFDFYLNDKNTLGMFVLYNKGREENDQPWNYWEENGSNVIADTYLKQETSHTPSSSTDYNLNYHRTFKKPKQELNFDATYSNGSSDGLTTLTDSYYTGKFDTLNKTPTVLSNETKNTNSVSNIQLDYTQPLKYNMRLESGAKAIIRTNNNRFISQAYNYAESKYTTDTALSNIFNYDENIYAAYSTLGGNFSKFGFLLGLRAEQAVTVSHLVTTGQDYQNNYFNFFPSIHLSEKINKDLEIGLSYSRRVNRPNAGNLNPFKDVSDPYNIRFGNPYLQPEYIFAHETNIIKYFKKGMISATVYYRKTNGVIQRIRTLGPGSVSNITFENLNSSKSYGAELILKTDIAKWWNTTLSANMFQTVIDGSNVDAALQNNNFSYIFKLISNMHVWKTMDIQVTGNYNGPTVTAQGSIHPVFSVDAGLKKEIFRNATLSLNVSDITNSRQMLWDATGTYYTSTAMRRRESRVATLTFTYRFGKATENKRAKKPQNGEQMDNGGGDMGM
jgi:outer membrane receptor protein involved in Fe transport